MAVRKVLRSRRVSPPIANDIDGAAHPDLPPAVTAEMSWLFSAGYSLLPLGGPDGKKPIVEFKDRKRLPLALVVERMGAGGSFTFGIRLGGLLVVDVDSDTPAAANYVQRRFGSSPVAIRTDRGVHLYFRHAGTKPKQVRLPGIAIDFKSGENEFVVGPKSQRPDGVIYRPEGPLVALESLPWFVDRGERPDAVERDSVKVDGKYPKGVRHSALKRQAHQLALACDTFEELLADFLAFRDWEIESPEEFSDRRIEGLARWYWDKREAGELWAGQDSVVQLHRSVMNELARRGEFLALALHGILMADHGHKPDALFAIVPDGLRQSGRLKAGRNRIYAAIRLLVKLGLIHCRKKPRGKRDHYLYQIGSGRIVENKGGRSSLILVSGTDTHPALEADELAA